MIKMPREVPKSWPQNIYKRPQRIEPLGSTLLPARGDQTRRSDRPDAAPASGHYAPSPRMVVTCPSLNIVRWSLTVTKRWTRSQPLDRMRPSIAPDAEALRVRSFPERVQCAKIPTGRIHMDLVHVLLLQRKRWLESRSQVPQRKHIIAIGWGGKESLMCLKWLYYPKL
jgi:hypothetical protein